MPKYLHTLLVAAALSMGFTGQAVAYDDDHGDEHGRLGWEHRQGHWGLENRHDDVHEELGEKHSAAHYYNPYMSRRGHRRLHGQLGQEHARQDNRLNWQHNGLHRDLDDTHGDYHGYYAPNDRPYLYFGR